jgi:hypothetical protein
MIALGTLMATIAFALLGLTTDEHSRKRIGRRPDPVRAKRMRLAAWAALALSFPLAVAAQGWIFGPILWIATTMLGAALVFLALNFLPQRSS